MPTNVYNFGAGPATLPKIVIDKITDRLGNFTDGMSIMEISHRSSAFKDFASQSEKNLRSLLQINDSYAVLFLQGGATQQFSMVPMNLANRGTVDYLITGAWSKKAADYAAYHSKVNIVADSSDNNFKNVSDPKNWKYSKDAKYFYYCANETIHGLEIHQIPNVSTPIVSDMSSTLCTRPINIEKYGLIFAGAQKNLGIAGLTIVIVKKNLIINKAKDLPPLMRFYSHYREQSMLNTSPVFSWYVAGLVFEWILEQGGLDAMSKLNENKASLFYNYIDNSTLYQNDVNPKFRSWVNIPFNMTQNDLEEKFIKMSSDAGFKNLKGHRTVGGMRASVYNAMPIKAIEELIAFM
ncbi:uncharacterized protein METZ01_LOCUS294911, partial [marine metagenome]